MFLCSLEDIIQLVEDMQAGLVTLALPCQDAECAYQHKSITPDLMLLKIQEFCSAG